MNKKNYITAAVRGSIIAFWIVVILLIYQLSGYTSAFSSKKTLYVATWPMMLDAQYLIDFEQKTGINIKITYFETAEELLSKVEATEGAGYDIILPTDYTIKTFIEKGLLKRIDKSKLTFWQDLDTRLLNAYFDPNNDYSIPFYWSVYGIGINRKLLGDKPPKTWGLIFDQQYHPEHIIMTNSPREAISVTALYLFGSIEALRNPGNQHRVRDLLIKQKSWTDLYSEERAEELLSSENNDLAFGLSADITRAMRHNSNVLFIVPDEGTFIVVDSIAIPIQTQNEELAYQFINYLYQPDVIDHHIALYNMCSPITSNKVQPGYAPDDVTFAKFHYLTDIIAESNLNNIWIDLLAS